LQGGGGTSGRRPYREASQKGRHRSKGRQGGSLIQRNPKKVRLPMSENEAPLRDLGGGKNGGNKLGQENIPNT